MYINTMAAAFVHLMQVVYSHVSDALHHKTYSSSHENGAQDRQLDPKTTRSEAHSIRVLHL